VSADRAWIAANKDTMQKFVDALIQGTARAKQDKTFAINTLKKYFKTDDNEGMDVAYEFFINEIAPDYPYAQPEQYADSIRLLAQKNEKIKGLDINKYLDSSFVKSASDRGVAKQAVK
jgi:ABC-type nitrate/sulfonate/bicarbonate transport system substrate-binding protein